MDTSTAPSSSAMYQQPDIVGVVKNEEWYRNNVFYGLALYNPVMPTFWPTKQNTKRVRPEAIRWVDKFYRALSYRSAQQLNDNYMYYNLAENNEPLPTPFINNQVIYQLLRRVSEIIVEQRVKPLLDIIHVKGLSREVLDSKRSKINMAKFSVDLQNIMGQDMSEMGIYLEPAQDIPVQDDEMLKRAEETMQEAVEIAFTGVVKDALNRNDYESLFKKLVDYLVLAWFSRVEVTYENGCMKIILHRPDLCIFDAGDDDEHGKNDSYEGVIRWYSLPELFADESFNFNTTEKTELQNIAKRFAGNMNAVLPDWYGGFNNSIYNTGATWWGLYNSVPKVGVARIYWKGIENGNQVSYTGSLVGGRYLKKWGEQPNSIRKKNNKSDVENYFITYKPDFIAGVHVSLSERLEDISDWIDALESRKKNIFARAKGRAVGLVAENLPPGVSAASIMSDITLMQVTVIPLTRTDDRVPANSKQFLIPLDFSLDVGAVQEIYAEIENQKAEMKRIASIPDPLLGQQQDIKSNKALETTIANAAAGLGSFLDGFTIHINNICQRIVDLAKLRYPFDKEEYELLLSPVQFDYIKILEEWSLIDIGCYIDQTDIYDEQAMSRIDRYAELQAANSGGQGWFDIENLVELQSYKTITEKKNYLAWKKRRWEFAQNMEKEAARRDAMQQNINNNFTSMANTNVNAQAAMQQNRENNELKAAEQLMAPPAG